MSARFSGAVETGRMWYGRPEQARVWINNTLSRTLLLGFDKANLVTTGVATTGRKRPARFRASVQPFFYDLADSGHLRALETTWHHIAAYAAGFQQSPHNAAYWLSLGQERELCRTEYSPGQYEVLTASCYNQNYHESDDPRLFAWNPLTRQIAWEEHYRRHPVVRGYRFQIYRLDREHRRLRVVQRGHSYEVPTTAIRALVQQAERVLRELWFYIQRNPKQVEKRYDAFPQDEWITRWQLYDPQPFNEFVGPRLRNAFDFTPDPQLFSRGRQAAPEIRKVEAPSAELPAVLQDRPDSSLNWVVRVLESLLARLLSIAAPRPPAQPVERLPVAKALPIPVTLTRSAPPRARGPPVTKSRLAVPEGALFFRPLGWSNGISLS